MTDNNGTKTANHSAVHTGSKGLDKLRSNTNNIMILALYKGLVEKEASFIICGPVSDYGGR